MNARRWKKLALIAVGLAYLPTGCTQWIPWAFSNNGFFWPIGQYFGRF